MDVRGAPDRRWRRSCWHGKVNHGKVVQGVRPGEPWTPTWEPTARLRHDAGDDGELFVDGCWRVHPTARGRDRARANEVPGEHRCKNCSFVAVSAHGLKIHEAKAKKSSKCKAASASTSKQAVQTVLTVRRGKHEEMAAEDGDEVHVDGAPPVDVLSSRHLGSFQEQDATTDQAVWVRLAQGRARLNQTHHVWIDENLTVDSKVRMCKTSIATIARHGSEALDLTPANLKMIHAWNAGRLATTTGRAHHEEGDEHATAFDSRGDVRLERLRWLGTLLRLPAHCMVHEAVRARFDGATVPPGSILMDAPTTAAFAELVAWAEDEESRRQLCSDAFPRLCGRRRRRRRRRRRQTRLRPRPAPAAPTTTGGPASASKLNPDAHSHVQRAGWPGRRARSRRAVSGRRLGEVVLLRREGVVDVFGPPGRVVGEVAESLDVRMLRRPRTWTPLDVRRPPVWQVWGRRSSRSRRRSGAGRCRGTSASGRGWSRRRRTSCRRPPLPCGFGL